MKTYNHKCIEVRFEDCINGMKSLADKSFDLCLTDPPYNFGFNHTYQKDRYQREKGKKYEADPNRSLYSDTIENYEQFSRDWFKEAMRVSKQLLFTCGRKTENLKMWFDIEVPLDYITVYKKNCQSQSSIFSFVRTEPILIYGKFKHKFDFLQDIIVVDLKNGFFRDGKYTYKHPSPKPVELYQQIIEKLQPKSVLDPFLGSFTNVEVCLKLGILLLGFEIDTQWQEDLDHRIMEGDNYKKQSTVDQFINT